MGGAEDLASGRAPLSDHAIVFPPSGAWVPSALKAERYPLQVESLEGANRALLDLMSSRVDGAGCLESELLIHLHSAGNQSETLNAPPRGVFPALGLERPGRHPHVVSPEQGYKNAFGH